jgi:hypothetical protein
VFTVANFGGIGAAIGQGFQRGVGQALQGRAQIDQLKQQLEFLKGLKPEEQQLLGFGQAGPSFQEQLISNLLGIPIQGAQQPQTAAPGPEILPSQQAGPEREITVRELRTGQTGLIPESEFDPTKFARI